MEATHKVPRGFGRFFRDLWAELKRVAWPSAHQLRVYTLVVIGSVFVIAAVLTFFDFLLAEGMVKPLFGR